MTREPIYAALYARLAAAAAFATTSRRLKHWNDVAAGDQPALFVAQRGETANPQPRGVPTKWTLDVDVYVYARAGASDDLSPAQIINPLLDAVTGALAVDNAMTGVCSLGGLVEHCWIEGAIKTDEGVLGEQSVAIIPVRIFAT